MKAERAKGNIAYIRYDKLVVHPPSQKPVGGVRGARGLPESATGGARGPQQPPESAAGVTGEMPGPTCS